MATIGLAHGREPARVRHRHHPRGRHDRALPREADVGPGLQRHHQHRHLRPRARRSSTTSPTDAVGRLLERRVPAAARRRRAAVRRGGRGVLGGRRHARRLPPSAQGRARRPGRRRHPGLPDRATACGSARAPRSSPDAEVDRPGRHRPRLRVEAGCRLGEYTVLGSNVRVLGDVDLERVRAARQRLRRAKERGCAARSSAARATSARTCASRRAWCSATRCFVGDERGHHRRRQGLPVQDDRSGRGRQLVDRVGEQGRALACSAATACAGWPTSTSRPSSRRALAMAYGTTLAQGRPPSSRHATRAARPAC